jgi:hypothetical protein
LNSEENALHTLKKNQVRNQEYRQKQLSENRKELDEKWQAETDLNKKAGLFPCPLIRCEGAVEWYIKKSVG